MVTIERPWAKVGGRCAVELSRGRPPAWTNDCIKASPSKLCYCSGALVGESTQLKRRKAESGVGSGDECRRTVYLVIVLAVWGFGYPQRKDSTAGCAPVNDGMELLVKRQLDLLLG